MDAQTREELIAENAEIRARLAALDAAVEMLRSMLTIGRWFDQDSATLLYLTVYSQCGRCNGQPMDNCLKRWPRSWSVLSVYNRA